MYINLFFFLIPIAQVSASHRSITSTCEVSNVFFRFFKKFSIVISFIFYKSSRYFFIVEFLFFRASYVICSANSSIGASWWLVL